MGQQRKLVKVIWAFDAIGQRPPPPPPPPPGATDYVVSVPYNHESNCE